jgi:hypothetical protein
VGTTCVFTNNNNSCDDGVRCTRNDRCSGGACNGTTYSCNDNNPCTDDECDGNGGCTRNNNNNGCNDGVECTHNDRCSNGSCTGTTYSCNDNNPCTADTCDGNGGCSNPATNNGGRCQDDGSLCGRALDCHVCQNGQCVLNTPHYNSSCVPSCGIAGDLCSQTPQCCPFTATCTQTMPSHDCPVCCVNACD